MYTKDFNYKLPKKLIAQYSVKPRDHSRMMVVHREDQTIEHKHFFDILNYLQAGDVIVWNNSKVFKARLFGYLDSRKGEPLFEHKKKIEIFLVRAMENRGVWKVLARPGRHVREGTRLVFANDFYCDVMIKEKDGTILVQFEDDEIAVRRKANKYGYVPIPPYIKNKLHELSLYQTVYAKFEGSVAAPTAGFHFTDELIAKAKAKGVIFLSVILHVGLGTFLPVKTEHVEDHIMHSEFVELTKDTAMQIMQAKKDNRRIIAIGTTTVRTLEGIASIFDGKLESYHGDINIFITPEFKFQIVDALVTNFHLPKSTLLMLVSAFVSDREFMLSCYKIAVEEEYRFFSFGDAMFIV